MISTAKFANHLRGLGEAVWTMWPLFPSHHHATGLAPVGLETELQLILKRLPSAKIKLSSKPQACQPYEVTTAKTATINACDIVLFILFQQMNLLDS